MITSKSKIFFSVAGLGFLIIHFTATLIYVAPIDWTGNRLKNYSNYYILPLFHQQWGLFAPSPPTMDKKVKLIVITPTKTYDDIILFDDFKGWHAKIRIGASGRFVLLLGNVMYAVYSEYYYGFQKAKNKEGAVKILRFSKGGQAYKTLVKNWLLLRLPELRNEKNFEVSSEIIFENYKGVKSSNEVDRDTIKIHFKYKNENEI